MRNVGSDTVRCQGREMMTDSYLFLTVISRVCHRGRISFFVVHMRLLLALSDVVAKPLRVSLYELPTASSCYGFF